MHYSGLLVVPAIGRESMYENNSYGVYIPEDVARSSMSRRQVPVREQLS